MCQHDDLLQCCNCLLADGQPLHACAVERELFTPESTISVVQTWQHVWPTTKHYRSQGASLASLGAVIPGCSPHSLNGAALWVAQLQCRWSGLRVLLPGLARDVPQVHVVLLPSR